MATPSHQRDIDSMASQIEKLRSDITGWQEACACHGRIHVFRDEYTRQLERENSELRQRVKDLEESK